MEKNKFMLNDIVITRIQENQVQNALDIIYKATFELQMIPSETFDKMVHEIQNKNIFSDMMDMSAIARVYSNNRGIFLTVIKDCILVGVGGLQRLNDEICEFTRIYFDVRFRGQGLGSILLEHLLDYAHQFGYIKVRLSIGSAEKQAKAINFYKKFGFYEVGAYCSSLQNCKAEVYMEKNLY